MLFFTLLKPLTDLVLFEQRRAVDLKRRKREAAGVGGREVGLRGVGGGVTEEWRWSDRGVEVE